YTYCVGAFSSRKIAQACERNLAFLAIVGTDRPDFRTISLFRKDHLDAGPAHTKLLMPKSFSWPISAKKGDSAFW
ncbi:MAG: transposase, partial [Isosphaeraceae bacterium]